MRKLTGEEQKKNFALCDLSQRRDIFDVTLTNSRQHGAETEWELIMTYRFILAATFATLMAPMAWSGVAFSDQLSPIVKACEENSACSYSAADPDGGMTFRIKRSSGVVARVYCSAAGECERLYPRGQRTSVDMIPSTLALR